MKQILLLFILTILVMGSCQRGNNKTSPEEGQERPADTLAYASLVDGLIWTNVCSLEPWKENDMVSLYALRQVSQNFLIDDSGKIVATELRGEDLIATLGALFSE